jgi:hypothetical protein
LSGQLRLIDWAEAFRAFLADVLRHTMLRKAAEKYGVQYAMELAGHTSSQYIWRYVKPTNDQKERAIEELF